MAKNALDAFLAALARTDSVLGGGASWIAAVLIIVCALMVAPEERHRVKMAVWFLTLHLVAVGILAAIPSKHPADGSLRLIGLALVLTSLARSSFVLFVYSLWMRKAAKPLPKILTDVIQGFVFAVVLLLVLRTAGFEPGSLLTTSALLTAVIGLSLQDTLGNLFAGLAIQAQRPFEVGDWVQLDSNGTHIGRVMEINWRATRVVTLERLEVTVPNGAVAKSSIINFSRPTKVVRREAEVHAPYDSPPQRVHKVLLGAMDHVRDVIRDPEPQIFTKDFTERGVSYIVRYFIEQFQDREIIDSEVRERLWYAMQRSNLAMPVPRRLVEVAPRQRNALEDMDGRVESATRLLGRLDFLGALSRDDLKQMATSCRRQSYTREEVVVHRGDTSTEMYVIESGAVRIEIPDASNGSRVVTTLGRGQFFGEMSLMTGERRAADVITSEETAVLVLEREAIEPLMERHPELAEFMSKALAERQRELESARKSAVERTIQADDDEREILRRIRRFFKK